VEALLFDGVLTRRAGARGAGAWVCAWLCAWVRAWVLGCAVCR